MINPRYCVIQVSLLWLNVAEGRRFLAFLAKTLLPVFLVSVLLGLPVLLRLPVLLTVLLLPHLLMSLNLGPLSILHLSLISKFPSFLRCSRVIALNAPCSILCPIMTCLPASPVPLNLNVRNWMKVPRVSVPHVGSPEPSPAKVYIKIKARNSTKIDPSLVIIMRPIPTAFPWAPPPAVPKKEVHINRRNNINVRRVR